MLEPLLDGLAWAHGFADELAWVVLALFVATAVAEFVSRDRARYLGVAAWTAFGAFWLAQIHHFAFVQKSIIEGIGTLVAVPACLYVGYLLYDGRDSLFVLTRAVAGMGLVFMPFQMIEPLREFLIETVTRQTAFLMNLLGYDPQIVSGATVPGENFRDYQNTFEFPENEGRPVRFAIVIGCTGIGSIAVVAGLVAAVRAPLRRKARALAVSVPTIYALNLVRTTFIAVTFGYQKLQYLPGLMGWLFGFDPRRQPALVSYYLGDKILAQTASVVAMVLITWLVVRELPEVLTVVEDVLFVMTGNEYDLSEELDLPDPDAAGERATRAD